MCCATIRRMYFSKMKPGCVLQANAMLLTSVHPHFILDDTFFHFENHIFDFYLQMFFSIPADSLTVHQLQVGENPESHPPRLSSK